MNPADGVRRLPLAEMVVRHPNDGWKLAQPYPASAATERALAGLVRTLLPPPPAPRSAEIDHDITRHVLVMVQYMPPALRLGFLFLVRLLDWSPVWRFAGLSRLSRFDVERGSQVLQGIATSRFILLRLLMLAPKAMVLSTYFDRDEAHAVLGYEPKGFLRERITRRETVMREQPELFEDEAVMAARIQAGLETVAQPRAEVAE